MSPSDDSHPQTDPASMTSTPLINPGALCAALESHPDTNSVKILDCRSQLGQPDYGQRMYAEGHLPGAIAADLDRIWAAPADHRGRHPLPNAAQLVEQLRSWGLNDTDHIVVYDDAGGAFAARAWWCLRWLGHAQVAVLDGGIEAWSGSLTRIISPPTDTPCGDFSQRPSLTRIATADDVLTRSLGTSLLDARTEARFAGLQEPIDSVAGHIPGAVCLPFNGNLTSGGQFLSAQDLIERFKPFPDPVICYCGSGVTAAHNLLAMVHAGRAEPYLYVGSWSEWIVDGTRPIATGA